MVTKGDSRCSRWSGKIRSGEVSAGYREAGYFPEACVNILAFLGWNPGTEKELYTLGELISDFDLEKVGRSGAKFDPDKAKWYNHQYLQQQPVRGARPVICGDPGGAWRSAR
jgi:glutamyl/glutaminyl-tRNA synthetase